MATVLRTIAAFLFLIQLCSFARAGQAELALTNTSEVDQTWSGLIPNFMMDRTGFAFESASSFAIPDMDQAVASLPLVPIYKSGFLGKTFIGVKIPSPLASNSRLQNGSFTISTSTNDHNLKAIAAELQKIKFDDGTSLNTIFYNGELYGIRSDYQVQMVNVRSIGFSLSFQSGKIIDLGEKFEIGGSLNLGSQALVLGKERGLNLFSHFNKLLGLKEELFNFEDSDQFNKKVLQFAPLIYYQLGANAKPLNFSQAPLKATTIEKMPTLLPQEISLQSAIPPTALSKELQTEMRTLQEPSNLQHEIEWQKQIQESLTYQAVWDNKDGAEFIQSLCDRLSAGYGVPAPLRPRCRIAASLAPNAWAYPGGDVFITAGLIGVLQDLDGLALVLGHEIGHVVGRHTTRSIPGRKAFTYAANGATLVAQFGLGSLALSGGRGLLGETNWLTWFPQSMTLSMGLGIVASTGLELLFFAPYAALMAHSRSNEWQADRFGQEIAIASGFRADNLQRGWSQFQAFFKRYFDVEPSWIEKIKQTHPSSEDRRIEISQRESEILKRVGSYSDENRLDQSFYESYSTLHQLFQPHVENWGLNLKNKRESGDRRASQFAVGTWLSPSGQCVLHALQGSIYDYKN